jgi:hypothetical protein
MRLRCGGRNSSGLCSLFALLFVLISRSMPVAVVFAVVGVTQKSGGEESYNIVVGAVYRHDMVRMYSVLFVCRMCLRIAIEDLVGGMSSQCCGCRTEESSVIPVPAAHSARKCMHIFEVRAPGMHCHCCWT